MATSISNVSDGERRWVVVGICLSKVLAPALRNVLATELQKWYNQLCQPPDEIDKQVYPREKKNLSPSTLALQYKNINNNHVHKSPSRYDYKVNDALSLAKLFVKPFMAMFTGFDDTMDMSAILAVMCEAKPFTLSGAAADAKKMRSDIRNKWAHCNFSDWTKAMFNAAIHDMESLLKKMNMSVADEKSLCDDLKNWQHKGLALCFGQSVDSELLKLVTNEVCELRGSVKTWKFESDTQIDELSDNLGKIYSSMNEELRELTRRIERCEKLESENSKMLSLLDNKFSKELSQFSSKQDEEIPYVFDAPNRNKYFSGRTEELQDLQRILKQHDTEFAKKACVAAVCGMGGIGKTSLVTEYAHQMKNYYQGGVYWFSAEDEMFFEQSVNDTALKLGASLGNFELTLTNTLIRISKTSKPCLIVLDCLDQLNISRNILKFLSIVCRHSASVAVVLMTRRNKSVLVEEVSSLHEDRCFTLKCPNVDESKQFLFLRTGLINDQNANSIAESLVEELGRLPLALEQAGACIKALSCSLFEYHEQYKTERLKLLEIQKAKPASFYESSERLAIHTTWLLNIKHIRESSNGAHAIRLMNAFAFFNANEIEPELVNIGERPIEDKEFHHCMNSPLGRRQVVKLLTDFSLFTYVNTRSITVHRVVQELIRENLDPCEMKVESFVDAVRLLYFAFSQSTSPRNLAGNAGIEERFRAFDFPANPCCYYLWSKLCIHALHLEQQFENILQYLDQKCAESLFVLEISKIVYECAVYLSANMRQEAAKRTLNFAYRIIDWIPLLEYNTTVEKGLSDGSLFPLDIPLPKWIKILTRKCCSPPMISLERLDEKPNVVTEIPDTSQLEDKIEELRSEGNKSFKGGQYKKAVDAYSSAIDISKQTNSFNPTLLTNRASAYIKLNQVEDALNDANEYIFRLPDCWRGHARKALALLGERVSAEIAAAISYYNFFVKCGKCLFSEYRPFTEAFHGLKERISICDTVSQLKAVLWNNQECQRVIVLGSKEYYFIPDSSLYSLVVNNCIMVGANPHSSVTLKFEGLSSLKLMRKCMFTNLSFVIDKGQILALPCSCVKMLNCNFTSSNEASPPVAVLGALNAERCKFNNCRAGGLLCEEDSGYLLVDNCTLSGNRKAGLEVRKSGILVARNSQMHNNGEDGLMVGETAAKCEVFDCQIYQNAREGIAVVDGSKRVTLVRNHVFENDGSGIFVRNSDVDMRENKFFDNESWGVWSQTNSWCQVSMNEIFRNKRGGVRVGKRLSGKEFPCSVVKLNKVYNNFGPGVVDTINNFEDSRLVGSDTDVSKTHGDYKSAKYDENVEYNNEERIISTKPNLSPSWCSGCFGKCESLKLCGKCFTAGYCNADCQKSHWSKHKKLCPVLREKSSFLINSMKRFGFDGFVNVHAKDLAEVGPNYCPPPPRDGKRFIVKLQTNFETVAFGERHMLMIYDRSLHLHESIQTEFIDRLVNEFGVLCERKYEEKKLFLFCVYEKNGKPRLFINQFADFQKW
ncbi:uncharacterized protein LOC114537435 [Dendronephthya gigantea]|uniref:uncharacterized protein LOC114537435 n=1 Tax=Dendronephthya gigantea TaxID=151771 RepID=UPI00106D9709|nr:uncharacterized protein LOC114537435 [Dendronephthya gigantea]XP_028414269.1 uncharacterized protein LOC114537435 [Dendronephthya gigantea]